MLKCNACIRQCVRVVLADVLGISHPLTKSSYRPSVSAISARPLSWSRPWRAYASDAAKVQMASWEDPLSLLPHYTTHKQKAMAQRLAFNKTSLQEELRYLKDPLKLAEHIVSLLRQDNDLKALELVRMSSKDVACTVSWNHLIDYEMSRGRVTRAIKYFNEMKKRAQLPDAHTFTIIFRGLAQPSDLPQGLGRALSIYQSMYAENCPVQPTIIHTNALLKVCARYKDIDALYGIAAKLPIRGIGAANNLTYTTIMNAIRVAASDENHGESHEEMVARRQQAVLQGRRMWGDIIERWKKGDIFIDEELTCSMGRLLLLGNLTRDHDDVFSLIEQTMGIQRQAPRSNHPNRVTGTTKDHVAGQAALPKFAAKELGSAMEFTPDIQLPENDLAEDDTGSEFNPVSAHRSSLARAGCNTLSMVVDACLRLHAIRPAQDYWGLLTDPSGPYKIAPDGENYHMYLRLLRVQRASKLCIDLIQEMRNTSHSGGSVLRPKTFRIALSTCVRDSNNPNVLDNAGRLVRIMLDTLEIPDVPALEMYLEIAKHPQKRDWRTLMSVIRGSVLGFRNLKSYLSFGNHGRDKGEVQQLQELKALRQKEKEVMSLATSLIGAHDITLKLGQEEMSAKDKNELREQRALLAVWIAKKWRMGKGVKDREEERMQEPIKARIIGEPVSVISAEFPKPASSNAESVEVRREEARMQRAFIEGRKHGGRVSVRSVEFPKPTGSVGGPTEAVEAAALRDMERDESVNFSKVKFESQRILQSNDDGEDTSLNRPSSDGSAPQGESNDGSDEAGWKRFQGGNYRPSAINASRAGRITDRESTYLNRPSGDGGAPQGESNDGSDKVGWKRFQGSMYRPSAIHATRVGSGRVRAREAVESS